MKVISFYNLKGGVGKTTTAVNVAACLGQQGYKVLLLDLDPQGDAGISFGLEVFEMDTKTESILKGESNINDAIISLKDEQIDILPSNLGLALEEDSLASQPRKDDLLRFAISEIKNKYDFILIDCPPNYGLFARNALFASEYLVIPIEARHFGMYALKGAEYVLNHVRKARHSIQVLGAVVTMYSKQTNLSNLVLDSLKESLGDLLFETIVPINVRLAESPNQGKSIFNYAGTSVGAKAYKKLTDEILGRLKK